jgi:hypothetical protein
MSRPLRFGPPPAPLRKAKLDNLALMPGSALAQIARCQEMANELPEGGVLIVLPANSPKQKQALSVVAKLMAEHGHQVRVISAKQVVPTLEIVQGQLDL